MSALSLEEQGLAQTAGQTQYTQNKLPLSLNTTAHCFCKQSPPNLLEKRVATGLGFRASITKFQEPNVVNHRNLLILLQLQRLEAVQNQCDTKVRPCSSGFRESPKFLPCSFDVWYLVTFGICCNFSAQSYSIPVSGLSSILRLVSLSVSYQNSVIRF